MKIYNKLTAAIALVAFFGLGEIANAQKSQKAIQAIALQLGIGSNLVKYVDANENGKFDYVDADNNGELNVGEAGETLDLVVGCEQEFLDGVAGALQDHPELTEEITNTIAAYVHGGYEAPSDGKQVLDIEGENKNVVVDQDCIDKLISVINDNSDIGFDLIANIFLGANVPQSVLANILGTPLVNVPGGGNVNINNPPSGGGGPSPGGPTTGTGPSAPGTGQTTPVQNP